MWASKMFQLTSFSAGLAFLLSCSRSNNLLLGHVKATVAGHKVDVTDCYRTSVPPPQILHLPGGQLEYRFEPCRDANILIRNEELFVNNRAYGQLTRGSSILVDHGVVSISASTKRGPEMSR
jgi:hypothetical protein